MIQTTKEEKLKIAEIELSKLVDGYENFNSTLKQSLILAFCMGMSYQQILDEEQKVFESNNFLKG